MRRVSSSLITSVDPSENSAVAVVDGEFKIPVKVRRNVSINNAGIIEAEISLAMSNTLYTSGDKKDALKWAVRASIELFRAVGSDKELLEPLKHLFSSLQDLDRGAVDPALMPKHLPNRPPDSERAWSTRACLAAALEARMRSGHSEKKASEAIAKLFGSFDGRKISDWRKKFKAGLAPAAVIIFSTSLEMMDQHASPILNKEQRDAWLNQAERRLIEGAQTYARRCD